MHPEEGDAGFEITLLGIDGIGKSTIAEKLAKELSAEGKAVELAAWRRHLSSSPRTRQEQLATSLWTILVRCLYGMAILDNGSRQGDDMPRDLAGYFEAIKRGRFGERMIVSNSSNALLAAAALENAAGILLHNTVVADSVKAGRVVIHESHAIKSVLKEIVLAARAGQFSSARTNRLIDAFTAAFFDSNSRDFTVVLWGSAEMARNWRIQQSGRFGPMEHFGLVGQPADETFVEFEELVQRQLLRLSGAADWVTVEITERPADENAALVIAALRDRHATK